MNKHWLPEEDDIVAKMQAEKRRRDAISSELLLRRLRRHHYSHAPKSFKDRWLPSTIIGNPLIALGKKYKPPAKTTPKPEPERFELPPMTPMAPIKTVLTAVSHYYRVPLAQILGARGVRKLVRVRQVAMYLAFETTTDSIAGIGRSMMRDHTTVIYGRKFIEREIQTNKVLALQVATLRKQIAALNWMPTEDMIRRVRSVQRFTNGHWYPENEALLVRLVNSGKSWQEVADTLGVSRSAAYRKYHRLSDAALVIEGVLQ